MNDISANEEAIRTLHGVARNLRNADKRIENIAVLGPSIGAMFSRNISRNFTTRGAFLGSPWKPLAPSTIAEKVRQGLPTTPLVRTRKMRESFVGRPMSVERYTRKTLIYGSNLERSVWQQYGTHRNGRRHIPPRIIFKVRREDRAAIAKKVADYVMKGKI